MPVPHLLKAHLNGANPSFSPLFAKVIPVVFCKRKMLKLAAKNAETACQMNGHCGIRSIACLSRKLSPVN
ncbi:hypothetical protein, partial [Paenibacillus puerhi]|uniref:hypothetical protein n=1 Tax=Paenibacillus puerhi TaxID=2692622 RepID=UPI001F2D20AD